MENTTKSRILDEALVMFAENGYKGTNLRDLAARLGLTKSALYKHYTSKEDIWNALLDRMIVYYQEGLFGVARHLPQQPKSGEELLAISMQMIDFTIHDERIILTRKLLLTEQFRDERVCGMATQYFLVGMHNMFTTVFAQMMEDGLIKKDDPKMLALMYSAPVTSLIQLCTREPEKQEEVIKQIEEFFRYFIENYVRK